MNETNQLEKLLLHMKQLKLHTEKEVKKALLKTGKSSIFKFFKLKTIFLLTLLSEEISTKISS